MGIWYFSIKFLEKTLLPSMIAAFFRGPKQGIPASSRTSTAPRTRGSSGATTAKSTALARAKARMPGTSVAETPAHSASAAMPPLPGRAKIRSARGSSFNFLMMACSRPPPPMTRIFIE